MCFYNSQSKRALDLAKRYGRKSDIIEIVQEIIDEQYKVTAFTHPICPIVTNDKSIQTAEWGLIPKWIKTENEAMKIRKMTLNARSETVFNLPSFRVPILRKRCLIPSTGYFEFQHVEKEVIPYLKKKKNGEIFSLGGIYEIWQNPTANELLQTFTILTVQANELCEKIHNGGKNPYRMPLIIGRANEEQWLNNSLNVDDIKQFFLPFNSNKMDAHKIAKDFLKKSPKDATIIKPAA
jgi:putative SOS response-associated peptidase YedK